MTSNKTHLFNLSAFFSLLGPLDRTDDRFKLSCVTGSLIILLGLIVSPVSAQVTALETSESVVQGEVIKVRGINNRIDKEGGSPHLTTQVNRINSTDSSKNRIQILADGKVSLDGYEEYPIQFDFFVNRRLFSSQIRTRDLPGSVGVDIGPDVAPFPFNYTIVARVLTPNGKNFVSSMSGAVFREDLFTQKLDCTLLNSGELGSDDSEGTDYTANGVSVSQLGNDAFSLEFEGADLTSSKKTKVTVSLKKDLSKSSSDDEVFIEGGLTLTPTETGAVTTTTKVTGTISREGESSFEELDVTSEDGQIRLRCA